MTPAIFFLLLLMIPCLSSAKQEPEGPWKGSIRYGVLSDFADNRNPRAYTHAASGQLSYNFGKYWSIGLGVGARAQTIGGQISKGREQTYDEVLSPSSSVSVAFSNTFWSRHKYSLFVDGEPLWDEASRLEGYKAILGGGGSLSANFWAKRLSFIQMLTLHELVNSYAYGSSGTANPDYFYTYKITGALKFYKSFTASYSFGAKVTRYMDDFIGYSYSNSAALSHAWSQLTVTLSYENGGFTDEGDISLWYIDEFRRLVRLSMGYQF